VTVLTLLLSAVIVISPGHAYDWARPGLERGWRLERQATNHSVKMAEAGRLYHTAPRYLSPARAEVIGYGSSRWRIWRAWQRSDLHRRLLASARYDYIGCGFAVRAGVVWGTCQLR
jgi:uncharacterized protein YkwD